MMTIAIALCFCMFVMVANGQVKGKSPHEARGVVLLDAFTFPKLIPNKELTFIVLVSNKKSIGDYGTDSIRADFFSLSDFVQTKEDGSNAEDIMFAQVLVNGAENARLAERMGMKPNFAHPQMFLFPKNSSTPIPYPENSPYQLTPLIRFISQNSQYNYRLTGTLSRYDDLVKDMVRYLYAPENTEKTNAACESDLVLQDFLQNAKEIYSYYEQNPKIFDSMAKSKSGESLTELDMAGVYVKTIENIMKTGKGYLKKELERIQEVLDEKKLSAFTRTKLNYQINILKSFVDSKARLTTEEVSALQNADLQRTERNSL